MTWTEPSAVAEVVRRHWRRGSLVRVHAGAELFEPIEVPIRGPKAGEIGGRLDDVRDWADRWRRASGRRWRLIERELGGTKFGRTELPARAVVDSASDAIALIGETASTGRFDRMRAMVPAELDEWLVSNPIQALEYADDWERLLAVVAWVRAHETRGRYVRQVDAPGVDTKFVEGRRAILSTLLDHVLESERFDPTVPASQFARRYGFAVKPEYVRFRHLDPEFTGFSEMTIRADELAATPPEVDQVVLVENEITYLALPYRPRTLAVWSVGHDLARFASQTWLSDVDLVYWGDLDAAGFAMLHRVRGRFPHTRSVLTDVETLLSHRDHWTRDPATTWPDLTLLTPAERDAYALVKAERVRLEQERIRFSLVRQALG